MGTGSKNKVDARSGAPCDVAIVGMGCLLPGAHNTEQFWANVLAKHDAIGSIPPHRFDAGPYFDADKKARDKIYSQVGGFLDAVPFDPMRYGIPPAALKSIDPIQLLALVAVEQALADAGCELGKAGQDRTSVILGMSGGLGDLGLDYAVRSNLPQYLDPAPEDVLKQLPEWTEDSFAGILLNVTSGRIANRFDLGGVNFTVDAACASSLAAVYLASRELMAGTSDMVIVGGLDNTQNPFGFLCFSKSQALSPTGRCKPFDASADGIAISEGVVMLVLKRLADAERDNDRIYAVIKGVAGSSDGRGRSMTAPRPEGQARVLRRAYDQAGFAPATVGLIEAHGTGTAAGDAAELAALTEIFRESGAAPAACSVGSVKSMIGHTKAAAGVTGLMKVALALHHRVQPPTLHVQNPNATLNAPDCPFYLNTEAQPWVQADETPRRAGVSSFGFGGTNFHVALEEYTGPVARTRGEWPVELFLWSAESGAALKTTLQSLLAKLPESQSELRRGAAASCRAAADAKMGGLRLAIVATSPETLKTYLETAIQAIDAGKQSLEDPRGIYLAQSSEPGKIAFLFSGQGAQYPWMFQQLGVHFPELVESVGLADQTLADKLPRKLSSYIFPPAAFTAEAKKARLEEITDTGIAQPALGAVEMGLFRLLTRLGIRPAMAAGHSYGEYAALCAAGVFSEADLYTLSEARGRAIKESAKGDLGTMCAVAADAPTLAKILDRSEITLANENTPRQTVLAGSEAQIEAATAKLNAAGIAAKRFPVACAFHSPLMEPARERLAGILKKQKFSAPQFDVYSNTLATRYPKKTSEFGPLLSKHLVSPVRFVDQIRAMYEDGARIFVEVGPKGILSGFAKQILEGRDIVSLQTDSSNQPGVQALLTLVGRLFVLGVASNTQELFPTEDWTPADAPAKPKPGWKVDGRGVYTAAEMPPVKVAVEWEPVRTVNPVVAYPTLAPPPMEYRNPIMSADTGKTPPATPAFASSEGLDAVMLEYQKLMARFLESQTAVMTAYLQGGGGAPLTALPFAAPAPASLPTAPAPAAPVMAPAPVFAAPAPAVMAPPPAFSAPAPVSAPMTPPVAAAPVAAPAAQKPWDQVLLAVVADRTGYPTEMLDLDAALEADLGVDSIKRVEILANFQSGLDAKQQAAIQATMDTLTRARTLRECAAAITAALGGASAAAPAPAPAAPAASASQDWTQVLREVVAERTGYPVDMLDPEAAMEADLGIDSIKRVEILANFQNRFNPDQQQRIQSITDQLTRARSLGEMGSLVQAALSGAGAVTSPKSEPVAGTSTSAAGQFVPRFAFAIVDRPKEPGTRAAKNRVCVITDDETGVAAHLASAWKAAGQKVVLLRHTVGDPLFTDGVFSADLTDAKSLEKVMTEVRRVHGRIGCVAHSFPLRAASTDVPQTLEDWRNRLQLDAKSIYLLAHLTGADLRDTGVNGGAMFAILTSRGGSFGVGSQDALTPFQEAAADFVKTFAHEFPEVATRIVDVDSGDPLPVLQQKILDELNSADNTLEIGLPGDRRITLVPQAVPFEPGSWPSMSHHDVVLLTGGARGVTAEIAKKLARLYRPKLVLVGSSPLPDGPESPETRDLHEVPKLKAALRTQLSQKQATVKPADIEAAYARLLKDREIRASIQELRSLGAQVEYCAVDVRNEAALTALLERIYREYGRLDYVYHGAGIIEDKLILDKKPDSFDRVLHTKSDSAFLLCQHLDLNRLKRLVFMSSVSGSFGNRGQADYSAANGAMDGLARRLSLRYPGKFAAVAWGPWDGAGMASEEIRKRLIAKGIFPIPLELGTDAAVRAAVEEGPAPLWVIGEGPWALHALPATKIVSHVRGNV